MSENPLIKNHLLDDMMNYIISVKGQSKYTVISYRNDLIQFFRFILRRFDRISDDISFDEIPIQQVDAELLNKVTLPDLYAFFAFMSNDLNNKETTRKRKASAIKMLYHYLSLISPVPIPNPTEKLELPKIPKRDPVYMTLDEALSLLKAVDGKHKERDLAIITLFLNCGMRLSELTTLRLSDIQDETIHLTGKGNKQRSVLLNDACVRNLNEWLAVRPKDIDCDAIFVTKYKSEYRPITNRAVQKMVTNTIIKAGLDPEKFSVHKLRHTAATLMYHYGGVDIRILQKVLGHESVSTTEIYTHVEDDQVREALYKNPLAKY